MVSNLSFSFRVSSGKISFTATVYIAVTVTRFDLDIDKKKLNFLLSFIKTSKGKCETLFQNDQLNLKISFKTLLLRIGDKTQPDAVFVLFLLQGMVLRY